MVEDEPPAELPVVVYSVRVQEDTGGAKPTYGRLALLQRG